jgi:outer membrane protein assembly factor BamB
VANGLAYVTCQHPEGSSQQTLVAVDIRTGTTRWTRALDTNGCSWAPAV